MHNAPLQVYSVALYASPTVRAQYAERHAGHFPQVQPNDVAFAGHALVLSLVILSQTLVYKVRQLYISAVVPTPVLVLRGDIPLRIAAPDLELPSTARESPTTKRAQLAEMFSANLLPHCSAASSINCRASTAPSSYSSFRRSRSHSCSPGQAGSSGSTLSSSSRFSSST